jgi:short subunit dehydrogenase-like uncharacterized protein
MARDLDLVLWGATGYTGQLVAEYLSASPSAAGLRWAIAGRDRAKLDAVHRGLRGNVEVLIGDAGDPASLDRIAARTKVVCSTVGPYAKYGSFLVAACVRAGTSYCDLTGEVPWVRRMIDEHHDDARKSGARIVHCCGFDSIPSDLGVWMLHKAMRDRGARLARVDAYFGEASGRFSGGTVASLLGVIDEARKDPAMRKVLGDPYSLDPRPRVGGPDKGDAKGVGYEPRLKKWTAPFVMAAINTRIVRRSNAVLDYPYGRDFRYTEQMTMGGGIKGAVAATGLTAALGGFLAASQIGPLRKKIEQKLPKPGEGPTQEQRERGYFKVRLLAEAEGGAPHLLGRVEDQRDPGYGSTCVMLSESALCLARDPLTSSGGVLTPASAMGDALLTRLRAAGMTFEVEERAD